MNEVDRERFREIFVATIQESVGKSSEQIESDLANTLDQLFKTRVKAQALKVLQAEINDSK